LWKVEVEDRGILVSQHRQEEEVMTEAATKLPLKKEEPKKATPAALGQNPFASLRTEIDHLFDEFAPGWPFTAGRALAAEFPRFERLAVQPAIEVTANGKSYMITAELPGHDAKNIEVSVADGSLSIRGEKKEETEEKKDDYYLSERRYGSFERRFQLPDGIDVDKIEASLNKGVLKVVLPKIAEAQKKERKVQVKSE
jgi:HSP20 family protein